MSNLLHVIPSVISSVLRDLHCLQGLLNGENSMSEMRKILNIDTQIDLHKSNSKRKPKRNVIHIRRQ